MSVIEFKSVGERGTFRRFQETTNEIPIGIKTPLRLGTSNDGLFAMHFSLEDQIHDNFRNMILTNRGERVGLYDFGGNLKRLAFEHDGNETFNAEAAMSIKETTAKYMPFIELQTFESQFDRDPVNNERRAIINVTYGVPRLKIVSKLLMIAIIVGG